MNFLWMIVFISLAVGMLVIGMGVFKIGLPRAFAYLLGMAGIVLIGLGSSLMPANMWRNFGVALLVIGVCMELGFIAIICLARKR